MAKGNKKTDSFLTEDAKEIYKELLDVNSGGGGGGGGEGTLNYNDLNNKPKINGVTLSGNISANTLGLAKASDLPDMSNYIQNTEYADSDKAGVLKVDDNGLHMIDGEYLGIETANHYHIKAGSALIRPIIPSMQHESVFYGLAEAAGDTTQKSSPNEVGVYTNDAKNAIKTMLGVTTFDIDDTLSIHGSAADAKTTGDAITNTTEAVNAISGLMVKTVNDVAPDNNGNVNVYTHLDPEEIAPAVDDWLDEHPEATTSVQDGSITKAKLNSEVSGLLDTIFTDEAKMALLACLQKVVWGDTSGQEYYNTLEKALFPDIYVTSISCVYTQSGEVYSNNSLDSLRADLVVNANFSNGTTLAITNYTLSGQLESGESTIIVTYGNHVTSFMVTVSSILGYVPNGLIHMWDSINNTSNGHDNGATIWNDYVGNNDLTLDTGTPAWGNDYISFNSQIEQSFVGTRLSSIENKTIEVVFSVPNAQSSCVFYPANVDTQQYGKINIFSDNTFSVRGTSDKTWLSGVNALTDLHYIGVAFSDVTSSYIPYANGAIATRGTATHSLRADKTPLRVGGIDAEWFYTGKIHCIRVYDRQLSVSEIAQNYNNDVIRFGLGA